MDLECPKLSNFIMQIVQIEIEKAMKKYLFDIARMIAKI